MIKSIKGIRAILALGIFISHLYILRGTRYDYFYSNYLIGLGAYGVLFFFILSGFGIGSSYSNKFQKIFSKETLSFYKKRIITLYPAYIIILFLAIIFNERYIFTDILGNIKTLFLNIVLLHQFTGVKNYNAVTWYLSTLLVFYLLTPIIIKVIRKLDEYKINLWFIIVLIYIIQILIVSTNLDIENVRFLFYEDFRFRIWDYIIGILLGYIYFKNKKKIDENIYDFKKYSFLEILCVLINILAIMFRVYVPTPFLHGTYYTLPILCLIIVLIKNSGIISKILSTNIVIYFSNISYEFYLIHLLVIQKMMVILVNYNKGLIITYSFVITLISSIIIHKFINVIMNIKSKTKVDKY